MNDQVIRTALEHVIIDTLRVDDLERLATLINDPVVNANTLQVPFPYSLKDAEIFYSIAVDFHEKNGLWKDWVIRVDGQLAGGIGLLYNFGMDSHRTEFGYWLATAYRGSGIMTAAVAAFSDHILATRPIQRLEAHIFVHNIASARVLEKCGFQLEGTVRNAFQKEGQMIDAFLFARVP